MSKTEATSPALGVAHSSAADAAYHALPPLLRGCTDYVDFCAGFKAAEKRSVRMIDLLFATYEFLPAGTIRDEADSLLGAHEQPISPNMTDMTSPPKLD